MFRKSKKWIGIIAVLILLILVGIGIIKFLPARPLTTEQKLEDFNYFYNVLVEYHPLLEEYKEVLGFDFEGNKEFYEELIRNTKDDYEFYVMMYMIMGDIPSPHTGNFIKSFDEIEMVGHNYSKEVEKAFRGRDRSEYWQECFMSYMVEDTGGSIVNYCDGQYIVKLRALEKQEEQTLILLSINEEPIDEYILRPEVNGRLAYDEYNDKVYRRELELNLRYGQLVKATFQNGSGEIFEREIYIRNKDCAFEGERIEFVDIPGEDKPVIPEVDITGIQYIKKDPGFYVVSDEARNLSYVRIYSFDDDDIDWEQVSDGMQKVCESDNIILDLRINEGGHVELFLDHIYPCLFKEDITVLREYTVTKAVMNDKLCEERARKFQDFILSENQEIVRFQDKHQGKGNGVEDKNVYVLIGDLTFSAADWVAAALKEYTNAVVIGTSTLGEGQGRTSFIDIMPNSKLTFRVYDSQSFNKNGTDNSIYGTSPEYYIPYTFESIAKRNQLQNVYDYENRLIWDNVLLETIEMITGEEP